MSQLYLFLQITYWYTKTLLATFTKYIPVHIHKCNILFLFFIFGYVDTNINKETLFDY